MPCMRQQISGGASPEWPVGWVPRQCGVGGVGTGEQLVSCAGVKRWGDCS